jgi:hypothetical protein
MNLLHRLAAVFLVAFSLSAFAGQKDITVDGMVFPAHPKVGKWVGKKSGEVATPNRDGFLSSETKDLGDCPLEIVELTKVPLHKTDDSGKGIFDSAGKLEAKGWVSQRASKNEARYFRKRLSKEGLTLLEPGGDFDGFSFEKDELIGEYYFLSIKVDHMGIGRTKNAAPQMPFKVKPSKENLVLSRYDQDKRGNIASVQYFVQDHLIGYQGELVETIDGREVRTEKGVPEKPFYIVELKFNPATQEPIYLDYTAGVVTGKNHNDWYFADTFNYECRDFKKVK